MENILEVRNLHVSFHTHAGEVKAVQGVNFEVRQGEAVAIVGESGCGKSVTAKTIMKLLPMPPAEVVSGSILFNGQELTAKKEYEMQSIRGNEIGMIFQDPMTSLNPTLKVGSQIAEGLIRHKKVSRGLAHRHAAEMLKLVGIPQAEKRAEQYPHEFSGGMRQRAMIAMALACQPKLLIADEPTTALDVTIQAQILALMKDLQKKMQTSIILITHDLGVVAEMCDRVVVMYAGKVVETGTVQEIYTNPKHPYTKGLLMSVPRIDMDRGDKLYAIQGSPPDLLQPPKGCSFAPRCKQAMKICLEHSPALEWLGKEQYGACWLHHPMAQKTVPN